MCAARRSVGVGRLGWFGWMFDVGDAVAVELVVVKDVDAGRLSCEGKGWRVGGPSL